MKKRKVIHRIWLNAVNGDEMADLNEIRKQSEKAAEAVCETARLKAKSENRVKRRRKLSANQRV